MALFRNLPDEVLENIMFRQLASQDSANLSHAHPVFGRVYRRHIMIELQATNSWERFRDVVDEVLEHYAGRRLERLSIRLRKQYVVVQDLINAAVSSWIDRARVYNTASLELHGNQINKIEFDFINWQVIRNLSFEWIHFPHLELELQVILRPLLNLYCLNLHHVSIAPATNLAWFLEACPNLRVLIIQDCLGVGVLTVICPLLHTFSISRVFDWTVTIRNSPFLTHLHVWSRDLPQFRLHQRPVSMAPIPLSAQDAIANIRSLFITVNDNLPTTIRLIQYFHHSLRHLHLSWSVPENMESQIDNMYELEELDTITIGGAPMLNEPLQIMVTYLLIHSPKLSRFTLVLRRCLIARVIEETYLSVIKRYIMERPRSSQQAQFEFSWVDNY